jgi:predicted glycosyltransferase
MNGTANPVTLFYVQHLLGIGHVFRAVRIAQAMRNAGFSVHMIWGGTRIPGMDLKGLHMHWLEALRAADDSFSQLCDIEGRNASTALLENRKNDIINLFNSLKPNVIVTETFPFGRRQMRFELEPLMAAARAAPWHPVTIASIRDILTENRKNKRIEESIQAVKNWYDIVLVHGDPELVKIDETLPRADEIASRIRYTGLVTPPPVDLHIPPSEQADIVVSAGGGAVGHALTAAAIRANRFSQLYSRNWLVIVGSERSETEFAELQKQAGDGVKIVRFVPDLARVLAGAKISVSRAGYNTIGDLIRARCRAILAPYTGGRETEQMRRAKLFSDMGIARLVLDDALTPQMLGQIVDEADSQPPFAGDFACDGAKKSAEIVREFFLMRQAV